MTKNEKQQVEAIMKRLSEVGAEPMPFLVGARLYRARSALSDAHFKLGAPGAAGRGPSSRSRGRWKWSRRHEARQRGTAGDSGVG